MCPRLLVPLLAAATFVACRGPSPAGSPGGDAGSGGSGGSGGGPGCRLRVADRLDVGPAPAGLAARAELLLENVGDEPCRLLGSRLGGCDGNFDLDFPAEDPIPAGGSASLGVELAVDGPAEVACELELSVSSDIYPVALAGHRDPSCLAVEPTRLDFGAPTVGCRPPPGEVVVENRCAVGVTLEAATVEGASAFVIGSPPLPASLPPGAALRLDARWRPDSAGPLGAELRLAFGPDGVAPLAVELVGDAVPVVPVVDRLQQPCREQLDLLVVIDNSLAMSSFRTRVADQLRPLPAYLSPLDFRLAITTTGLTAEAGAGCPGGADGGEDGRFFPVDGSRPRILTRDTPDLQAAWEANLAVGACTTGPATALDAALRALTPPLSDVDDDPGHPEPRDGNLGFWRDGAHLSVVFVTNRSDASVVDVQTFYRTILERKGFRNADLFGAHAITGDAAGCTGGPGSAETGSKLLELVDRAAGGVFQSICADDWGAALRQTTSTGWTEFWGFFLSAPPADRDGDGAVSADDLTVRVDGVEVAPTGPDGREVWRYDPAGIRVQFQPLATPEPCAAVEFEYLPACEETAG